MTQTVSARLQVYIRRTVVEPARPTMSAAPFESTILKANNVDWIGLAALVNRRMDNEWLLDTLVFWLYTYRAEETTSA